MAIVDFIRSFNMFDLDRFAKGVEEFSFFEIAFVGGRNEAVFTGDFFIDYSDYVGGEIDAVDLFSEGFWLLNVETRAFPADEVIFFAEIGDFDKAFQILLSGDDTVYGSPQNDVIRAFDGSDAIYAGLGNDDIISGRGGDFIDGDAGLDIVYYEGARSQYDVFQSVSTIFVNGNPDGFDELIAVERLNFVDGTLAFDTQGNAGMAYRIYQAAFDRTPDDAGLRFWINQLDNGVSLKQAAEGFVQSAEFRLVYGIDPTSQEYVDRLYHNVLGRPGEAGGFDFWTNALDTGRLDEADVLMGFSESWENITLVQPAIEDGIFYA